MAPSYARKTIAKLRLTLPPGRLQPESITFVRIIAEKQDNDTQGHARGT
jgi:hypothetical protein